MEQCLSCPTCIFFLIFQNQCAAGNVIQLQYSPDNLTLTNSHLPDNSQDCPRNNSS